MARHSVAVTIAELKRALGEYGSWITHRPKVGYRLEVPGAEDLIRQGWHFWGRSTREGLEKGLECFEQAARQDPSDNRAYEGTPPFRIFRWALMECCLPERCTGNF